MNDYQAKCKALSELYAKAASTGKSIEYHWPDGWFYHSLGPTLKSDLEDWRIEPSPREEAESWNNENANGEGKIQEIYLMNPDFEYEMRMSKNDSTRAIRSVVEGCLKHLQEITKKRPDNVTVRAGLDIHNTLKVYDNVYQKYDVEGRYSKFIVIFDLEVEIVCDWEIDQEAIIVQVHFAKSNNA